MNHEPECTRYGFDQRDGDCICDIIRAAYQRGREDAAKDVANTYRVLVKSNAIVFSFSEQILANAALGIDAARGDGAE